MAATKITDVIVPDVFNPYFIERTAEMTRLWLSGMVSTSEALDRLATSGGTQLQMPFWTDLSGDSEELSDGASLSVNNIASAKDIARLHMRGKAWGVNDLARALSGDDPMRAIADLAAQYWVRQRQKMLVNVLTGVFADNAANDADDMINDVAIEAGDSAADANLFNGNTFIDTEATFGDSVGVVSGLIVHSVVYNNMRKNDLIDFIPDSDGNPTIATYMGRRVLVDDGVRVVAGGTNGNKYWSYLFGQGAIAFAEGGAPVPSETDRDSLAGEDMLITRTHFILHPRGVAWQEASVAGDTPTFAEAATATNWNRVYERNNVRLAALVTNG